MITGSIVALITPMKADTGEVDWPALERLIEWHIAEGTQAIGAVGTTGEAPTLGWEEHIEVIRYCVHVVAGRIPVIAGTGANSTAEAVELTAAAKRCGADAALLVAPYYNRPTQEGMYRHFRAVAEAVDIPQILYNVPARTASDLLPETVERLARLPNVVGIKEASGNLDRVRELLGRVGPDFAVYSGDDATACELMLLGGRGNISVTANVAPRAMRRLCDLALAGRAVEARALQESLMPLHRALFLESNPIPVKWAAAQLGLCEPGIRLPLTELSPAHHEAVRAALRACGVAPPAAVEKAP